MKEEFHLYTDGGSRNNPGPSAVGYVIKDPSGKILERCGKYIGSYTNNEAEYYALIEGLTNLLKYSPRAAVCFLDSQLVVNQLNGKFKVRKAHLAELLFEIKKLEQGLSSVEYKYIPRDKNFVADSLVNKALDQAGF